MSGPPQDRVRVPIRNESDLTVARRSVREFAARAGLANAEAEALATAVTELARNVLDHAIYGSLRLQAAEMDGRLGVKAIVRDEGPGIPDIARAMQDGYSTNAGLGLGLPGARSLVDEFRIDTEVGRGTTITLWKWCTS
jgi:serine/threonine-protein kinase RsbT